MHCRKDLLTSMLPKYRELLKYNLSILVFSGDVDAIVPVSVHTQKRAHACPDGRGTNQSCIDAKSVVRCNHACLTMPGVDNVSPWHKTSAHKP